MDASAPTFVNGHEGLNDTNGFGLAPGAERFQNGTTSGLATTPPTETSSASNTTRIMDYSVDFPSLPDAPRASKPVAPAWGSVKSTTVTSKVTINANQRANKSGKHLGDMTEEQQRCNMIAREANVKIELSESKDHSLTILITGKSQSVEEARARLLRELQTQAHHEINVPKEFRGILIGKEGSNLKKLEQEFAVKIQMPKPKENSDAIRIHGPPEFVNKAVRFIENKVSELAKQANETISIPRNFYPWIRGPANENIERWQSQYNVKVNIPPPSSEKETINVNGEREGVYKTIAEIQQIYNSKKNAASITCTVPKAQHRFVLGTRRSGLDEILRATGVVVEVPSENDDSDVLTLYGDTARLADALSLVYAKATSIITREIKYDEWQRRYLIGPKGATLQQLVPKQEKLKIDFEDGGVIYLEGSPEQVNNAAESLQNEINRLTKEYASEMIKVPANLHRHIVGRNGALINKLKSENDVQIMIPDENKGLNEIRVEGNKKGVKNAINSINEIVTRLENEKSRDVIIEQRFHGMLIGKNGENINKWRHEYPSVSIAFPDSLVKSDIVSLRGDRKEVDKLATVMTKMHKDLLESNYQETIPIFKEFYKHIIGKNGSNINKIREETNVRIEKPADGNPEGRLTIIGKQANVEKAVEKLNKIQNELASIITVDINVPHKIHSRLLAHGRRLIRDIEDEFGGVHILFPKEKNSDKVTIRGPKDDVTKAQKTLVDVAKHVEETTEEASVETKPEYIKFLIGREGSNVKKLREAYPSVRIIFPETGSDQKIYIIGKKDEVQAVKNSYEKQIKELNETVEIYVEVEPKYHKHFLTRSAEVVKEIQEQNGGVSISFPKQDTGNNKVAIKGSKQCAESAKQRVIEIVEDLNAQITENISIPEVHHRAIVPHANELRNKYNVRIKFPTRGTTNETSEFDDILSCDLVTITGRDTKVAEAKIALMELIPVTKTIQVPMDFHSSLIGKGGESVRHLMTTHAVRIKIPSSDENSDIITVTGAPANVEACFENIRERLSEYEAEAEDRKLRSFTVTINVPLKYHQRLIGIRGSAVRDLQARHVVTVKIPRSEENSETITIIGYESKANECKKEIEDLINSLESMVTQEIDLDPRFHPRLIGQKGRNLRKLQDEYKVEIRLPGRNDPNPSLVVVAGSQEEIVLSCCEKLKELEEAYIEDLIERGQYISVRHEPVVEHRPTEQVQIQGAPWQLDNEQFPAMGEATPTPVVANSVWGNRRW